jgi:hypothetical protein
MDDKGRLTLSESLRSTAIDLGEAADVIAMLGSADEEEIKRQAEILNRIASDVQDGVRILRTMIIRQRNHLPPLPSRRVPPDPAVGVHRVPPDRGRQT